MADYKQDNRPIKVETPLGADILLLERFTGTEGISRPFEFHLTMVSEQSSVDLDGLLRKPVTIKLRLVDGQTYRPINGWVRAARQLERDMYLTTYQMEIVPWFWFLTQSYDCRIYQNMTVQEIISDVFGRRGMSDYQFKLYGSYDKKKYLVQYRESDFNFVSRLMEEEGMFYFFEQSDGRHVMVITDSKAGVKVCPHQDHAKYAYQPQGGQTQDFVHTFDSEQSYHTGKVALNDFDFIKPSTKLDVNISGKQVPEMYDYPGRYYETGRGDKLARVRLEEQEALQAVASGVSGSRGFEVGYKFSLEEHYRSDLNKSWLLTTLHHYTAGNNYRSDIEEPFEYTNHFEVIPADTQFRPARTALKPRVYGSQTAIVTGPKGEEIYVDKYGRVKIQFHWDRIGKYDENSSCWVRVSQFWAGKGWGAITIPRIGQEVVVDHMEGDPDRPMITGRVYNAEQVVPYKLPDHQTVSTWKSRSSKKGSETNYNEIRMEDLKGQEQLFIHAEYDRDDRTKHDYREWVGNQHHVIVKDDELIKIEKNQHIQIGSSLAEKIGGNYGLSVGGSHHHKVGMLYSQDTGQEIHLKAGMKVVIEAGMELTLKGPGGFIDINPSGIYINGTMVFINSGGVAGVGSPCQPDSPKDPDVADDGTKRTKM